MKPRHPAPLNALRAFEAVARHLSFQAAAGQLFVTPAAVSHQVKHLEAYLGVKLFHRGHRSIALTVEGEALAASLSELFGQLDLALDRATAPAAANLRVSTVESFAAKWLAPRLHRFHRDCPDLKTRIETGNEPADFGRGGVDVAVRYGRGGYAGVTAERLMEAPVFPVCAPSLATGGPRPLVQPDDLRHHTLLHDESAAGRPGVPDWPAWLAAAGAADVDATRGPVFASIYLAQEAAVAGHGVALGVAPLVEEDLRHGRLVRPFDRAVANAYAFWIVRPRGADANPAVDAFCRWLRREATSG
ncbi:transcriptional regulator GcvA [Tahibacter soli]|uniref:Transcriptional regulator GcvA n=1 Tax=Tahibacter soli TaxID=2983605 RepID=A0A9X3YRB5_9GAMM|nr:transcriptional regulator GcvA [Tahibacter soli]MDC8016165.1 transcriptional regulator GcvA [Tahibacter soli]